jgi:hypothetical protein
MVFLLLSLSIVSCGGGGSTPSSPTPSGQTFTLSGIVTEGPATSAGEGYFRDDTGGNQIGGFGRGSQSVLGEQSREREQPDEILIDANPNIADPLHAAGVGDTVAGVVVRIADGTHMGKSATTGSDGSYQIVGVSGGMTLTAEKSGYKTQTKSVTVSADTTLNFALAIDILTYTLSGYVREDGVASSSTAGEPVSGVVVRVTDGPYIDKSSTTGSDGRYEIVGVVGGMTLSATRFGYTTLFKSVTVTSDTPLDFDVGRETRNIGGLITDIVTGAAVGNLTVEIEGVGTTTTDGAGKYSFDTDVIGTLPMTLSGAGYIRRDTYIIADGTPTMDATVIFDGNGFSLAYHDEVFRDAQPSGSKGITGTRRWTYQPTFQIWLRKFKCTEADKEGDVEYCKKAEALEESVSGEWFDNTVRSAITGDVSRLTGGKYSGSPITTRDFTPGTIVTMDDITENNPGQVNILLVDYPNYVQGDTFADWTTWWWYPSGDAAGQMYSAHIMLNDEGKQSCSYRHELAHSLGWSHPNGYDFSHYGGSIMDCDGVTARDELQGRIMYLRPEFSLTPDVDPAWARLNTAMFGGGRGGSRLEKVRAR